jgi:glyoxylase-like metal-dependent hydrolase (beta-lactamase superfamily II)
MTVEQLFAKMESPEGVYVLDVRNDSDYKEWKIEGKRVQSVNIPYFDFLEDAERSVSSLPRDREIAVVCARSGSSKMVAELLSERGIDAAWLEGGMHAWSQFYDDKVVHNDGKVKIIQINRRAKGCLSYAVVSQGKGMIVDPSHKIEVYLDIADRHQFRIEHVVDSHLHADHITGGPALAERTGARYYLSSSEAKGTNLRFVPLEDHPRIRVGEVDVEVLAIPTPGHTPGSTSFLIDKRLLLSGDTIFVGGLGRPDLGGKAAEWAEDLYDTVFHRLRDLPDDCLILPAHFGGPDEINDDGIVAAKLGDIRVRNEIMRNDDRKSFTEQVARSASMEKPPNFETILAINRGELQVDADRMVELEIGPNRCAAHHLG